MLAKSRKQIIGVTLFILFQFFAPATFAAPFFASPANDDFTNALVITGASGNVRSNNAGATKENWERSHAGNSGGASVWYRWIAPVSGEVRFDTAGSNFDTILAVYTWPIVPGPLVLQGENDDTGTTTSRVVLMAVGSNEYFIAVDGYDGATGAIQLSWVMPNVASPNVRVRAPAIPSNDNLANAQAIGDRSGSIQGSNRGASKESWEGRHAANPGGASLWYRWVSPGNGITVFDTYGSNFDTLLAVYIRRDQTGALVGVGSNDDANSEGESRVEVQVNAGAEYLIAVDGYGGATGNFTLNWAFTPTRLTTDLAIIDLVLPNQPRGTLYVKITNNGPTTLSNQNVTIACRARYDCRPQPERRCTMQLKYEESQRTFSLTLRSGQTTNLVSTNMLIDLTDTVYPEVTCRLQGNYDDPRPSNNAYTTSFR